MKYAVTLLIREIDRYVFYKEDFHVIFNSFDEAKLYGINEISFYLDEYDLDIDDIFYYFHILCISTDKLDNDNLWYSIYNEYKKTNDLFNSISKYVDCDLELDANGNVLSCKWNNECIDIPYINGDINKYKYDNGTIVEYNDGIYLIYDHSKDFKAEDILTGKIEVHHSYSMSGIKNGIYDHIRADDEIDEDLISTNISESNKKYIPFVSNILDILDSSKIDGFVDEGLVMKKFYYWLITGIIKCSL